MGELEPLGVNFGPIYAQNLSFLHLSFEKFLQLLKKSTVTPDKYPKVILIHR